MKSLFEIIKIIILVVLAGYDEEKFNFLDLN